jgi:hypothetical protein
MESQTADTGAELDGKTCDLPCQPGQRRSGVVEIPERSSGMAAVVEWRIPFSQTGPENPLSGTTEAV